MERYMHANEIYVRKERHSTQANRVQGTTQEKAPMILFISFGDVLY